MQRNYNIKHESLESSSDKDDTNDNKSNDDTTISDDVLITGVNEPRTPATTPTPMMNALKIILNLAMSQVLKRF